MINYNTKVKISDEDYWKTFPRFQFHRPFFCRWYWKRKHKYIEKHPEIKNEIQKLEKEIDKFLAWGNENAK